MKKSFSVPTLEETFKGERTEWRNARKDRERIAAKNRARGTGNRLDGLCHIDLQPCHRAAKCAFKCIEVCSNAKETYSAFVCANAKPCGKDRTLFTCGLREANITE